MLAIHAAKSCRDAQGCFANAERTKSSAEACEQKRERFDAELRFVPGRE